MTYHWQNVTTLYYNINRVNFWSVALIFHLNSIPVFYKAPLYILRVFNLHSVPLFLH